MEASGNHVTVTCTAMLQIDASIGDNCHVDDVKFSLSNTEKSGCELIKELRMWQHVTFMIDG